MKCPHCPAEVKPGAECAYCGRIAPATSPRTYDPEDVEVRIGDHVMRGPFPSGERVTHVPLATEYLRASGIDHSPDEVLEQCRNGARCSECGAPFAKDQDVCIECSTTREASQRAALRWESAFDRPVTWRYKSAVEILDAADPAIVYDRDADPAAEVWVFTDGGWEQSVRVSHCRHLLHDDRLLWLLGAINPFTGRAHIFHRGFLFDDDGNRCGEVDVQEQCPGLVWEFVGKLHMANG